MKNSINFRMKTAAIIFFAVLLLSGGCKNFMGSDDDLKAAIDEEVKEANAPEISITVRAENDSMGTTSPLGVTTVKVGVPFNITTTVNSEYAFLYWAQVGGSP